MVFVWLLEFAASVVVAVVLAYFLLLTSTPHAPPTSSSSKVSRRGNACSASDDDVDGETYNAHHSTDTFKWVLHVQRWWAAALLGGGSSDRAIWTDRISYALSAALRQSCTRLQHSHQLLPHVPCMRIERLVFGPMMAPQLPTTTTGSAGHHLRTTSTETPILSPSGITGHSPAQSHVLPLPTTSTHLGTALPCVEGIVSSEVPESLAPGGITSREFRFQIQFCDSQFMLLLHGELPVLFGLPRELMIPADLLTIKCKVEVKRIHFRAGVWLRMRGNRMEWFLDAPAEFDADVAVFAPGVPRHSATPTESKAGELLMIGLRRALLPMVFPNVLVSTLGPEPPYLRWSKERLESDAA